MKTEDIAKMRIMNSIKDAVKLPVCERCYYYLANPDKCKICEFRGKVEKDS